MRTAITVIESEVYPILALSRPCLICTRCIWSKSLCLDQHSEVRYIYIYMYKDGKRDVRELVNKDNYNYNYDDENNNNNNNKTSRTIVKIILI